MRRLLLLVSALVFVDTLLYAALTPLLPHLARQLGLGKGAAGALLAAYAVGVLAGALPGGLAAVRLGPRATVLIGLALVGIASVAFAFAGSFGTLFGARLLQGTGSACTWAGSFSWLLAAAPRERRGELLGTALGAAVFGALFGPVIGAAAALAGRAPVFSALAGVSIALAAWTSRLESPAPSRAATRELASSVADAFASARFSGGLVLMSLAALLFGILSVLGSLHLAHAGWGAAAIGAVWLAGAALEGVESPLLGRLSDRSGPLSPLGPVLAAGTVVSLGLATGVRPLLYAPLVLAASASYGALFTPAFTLIADGAERAGLAQGMAFGLINAAWALGAAVGPAAAGVVAAATGDWVPFLLAAAACLAALIAIRAAQQQQRLRAAPAGLVSARRL